jgi:hypothetical protein
MTSRFERLGISSRTVLIGLTALIPMLSIGNTAYATTAQNKTIVFEIKTGPVFNPSVASTKVVTIAAIKTEGVIRIPTTPKPTYNFPPKTAPENRVYMHEPEIRAYICPKLGDKCNIFIAVLKAENGTHECTRDNRGLNKNGSVDIGLAQINWRPGYPHSFEQLQDCKYNLDAALEMYSRRGFQPWYAYTKGAYLKHLPAVLASAKVIATPAPELSN